MDYLGQWLKGESPGFYKSTNGGQVFKDYKQTQVKFNFTHDLLLMRTYSLDKLGLVASSPFTLVSEGNQLSVCHVHGMKLA